MKVNILSKKSHSQIFALFWNRKKETEMRKVGKKTLCITAGQAEGTKIKIILRPQNQKIIFLRRHRSSQF